MAFLIDDISTKLITRPFSHRHLITMGLRQCEGGSTGHDMIKPVLIGVARKILRWLKRSIFYLGSALPANVELMEPDS